MQLRLHVLRFFFYAYNKPGPYSNTINQFLSNSVRGFTGKPNEFALINLITYSPYNTFVFRSDQLNQQQAVFADRHKRVFYYRYY